MNEVPTGPLIHGIPVAVFNVIGSRTLVGADDAWTPMVLRTGGAVANVALNAVFIFGLGMCVVAVPVAALGLVTPLGVTAVYVALVLETAVPAAVTFTRYRAGTWKVVSRDYRPDAAPGA